MQDLISRLSVTAVQYSLQRQLKRYGFAVVAAVEKSHDERLMPYRLVENVNSAAVQL